ncbi:MAG: Imm52 family immunity protein [Myxococcota bacterium]
MFVGAYWAQRKESKESGAHRIATFLTAITDLSDELGAWYSKGRDRSAALRTPVEIEVESIERKLNPNHRDADRQPISDLGLRFSAWNGANASFSVTIGSWNKHVRNAAVLDLGDDDQQTAGFYRALLTELVRAFEPDHAVVASHDDSARTGATMPWEAGMFTYTRGGTVQQHSMP